MADGRASEGAVPTASEAIPPATRASVPARVRHRRFSPLTWRLLLLNTLPLILLGAGVLYLDDYRRSLIDAELAALTTQGRIIAAALGEAAAIGGDPDLNPDPLPDRIQLETGRQILRRLVEPTRVRARLFAPNGELIADTRVLSGLGGAVEVAPLPPPGPPPDALVEIVNALYDVIFNWLPRREALKPERVLAVMRASDFAEVEAALRGETATALRAASGGGGIVLGVAVPVQRFKQVLGGLLLTGGGESIERNLREVRIDIFGILAVTLAVTVLVSLVHARTIAKPIRRLAAAAERVRRGHGLGAGRNLGSGPTGQPAIPDFSRRGDEIGDLSAALSDMTQALWQRLDAIERFAADVAHELKNPLTSLRSAVETVSRVSDPAQRTRLMAIVLDDVARLDRLIADISDASRLDAELSRAASTSVDIARLLATLAEVHAVTAKPGDPRLILEITPTGGLVVAGLEERLGQVLRNLIANAVSFSPRGSPRGGVIRLTARRRAGQVEIAVEDQGPGLPEDKLEAIFERFYSERPAGEKFGTHSGLGLSISRQIVSAHGGTILAENCRDAEGRIAGARFVIRLPVE